MADRTLRIYLDGTPAGMVTQSSHRSLGFTDDEDTVQADPTLSRCPFLSGRHRDKAVRAYLEGLLPDSEGVRQRSAREYNVSPNNPFALLAHVGRDAAGERSWHGIDWTAHTACVDFSAVKDGPLTADR
jgi:serine/threonine-protein kinase HipA